MLGLLGPPLITVWRLLFSQKCDEAFGQTDTERWSWVHEVVQIVLHHWTCRTQPPKLPFNHHLCMDIMHNYITILQVVLQGLISFGFMCTRIPTRISAILRLPGGAPPRSTTLDDEQFTATHQDLIIWKEGSCGDVLGDNYMTLTAVFLVLLLDKPFESEVPSCLPIFVSQNFIS